MTLFSTKQYVKQEQEASTLDLLWLFCFEDKEVPPDLEVFCTNSVQVLCEQSSEKLYVLYKKKLHQI
jgi:hypothetical protein